MKTIKRLIITLSLTVVIASGFIMILNTPVATIANTQKTPKPKEVIMTLFWIGEESGPDNDYISNKSTAWVTHAEKRYGGFDNPKEREGFFPKGFIPLENPFYFALPYNDLNDDGSPKENRNLIPWFDPESTSVSQIKGSWIKITYMDTVCYAQWADVGPNETDDIEYVFGNQPPKNQFGVKAGLDVSPAVWTYFNLKTNPVVTWEFVDFEDVPPGPWKDPQRITSNTVYWE